MEFVVKAGGCKQTLGDVCQFLGHRGSIGPICWRMCQRWALGPLFFFVSGKSPAGLVCGITPQDPSRVASQKRKQLSDNELLCCDQTSAFARSGWGSWECVKNHTLTRRPSCCSCAHVWMQMLVNFTCEQNLKLKHFYYLDGTLAGVVSQHSINPLRLKINTPCSLIHYSPKKKKEKKISDFL